MKATLSAFALAVILCASRAHGQVPQAISYQGLLDLSGNSFSGNAEFKFALVNASGSASYWSNDGTSIGGAEPASAVSVTVTNGLFEVLLGDTNILHMTMPVPSSVFTNADVRLRIWVRQGAGSFQRLSPDQRLSSVGYAMQAARAAVALSVAPGVITNVGTVVQINTGAGLSGGPITSTGTIAIPNGAISNAMLQNASVRLTAGSGLSGGGSVPLGGTNSFSVNLNHDASLLGNGGSTPLTLNPGNPNTWTASQTFVTTINGDISGSAAGFRGVLAGDVSGTQGATTISNLFRWQTVAGTSQQARPNTGYVLTNAARVTLTLPTNANLGDTFRISAPGAGGWKIAQNAGQSIFSGNFDSIQIGLTWINRASTANWSAIACSADSTKLAATVNGGQISVSTDSGTTWAPRDSNRAWSHIACSADGTKLVAVVNGGQIYTSVDLGATWTPRETNRAWSGVASSADGTKLVATVNAGLIYISADSGVTWSPRASAQPWYAVASSSDGTKLVAVVYGSQIATSTDSGATWSPLHGPSGFWGSVASSSDGTKLVIANRSGQLQTSTDSGATWTPRETARAWYSVASSGDGTKLAAVVNGGQIYVSTDSGLTWEPHENNRAWYSIAMSANGTRLAAAPSNAQIYISIPAPTSSASTTLQGTAGYLLGGQATAIELQYIGNHQFLPLSHEGTIWAY